MMVYKDQRQAITHATTLGRVTNQSYLVGPYPREGSPDYGYWVLYPTGWQLDCTECQEIRKMMVKHFGVEALCDMVKDKAYAG